MYLKEFKGTFSKLKPRHPLAPSNGTSTLIKLSIEKLMIKKYVKLMDVRMWIVKLKRIINQIDRIFAHAYDRTGNLNGQKISKNKINIHKISGRPDPGCRVIWAVVNWAVS